MAMFNLMLGLRKMGLQPILISTLPARRYAPLYEKLVSSGVRVIYIGHHYGGMVHWPTLIKAVVRTLRKVGGDLLHAHTPKEAFSIAISTRIIDRRFIYTIEGDPLSEVHYAEEGAINLIINGLVFKVGLKAADGLASCSRWLSNLIEERYGIPSEPIPNPVDVERFSKYSKPIQSLGSRVKIVATLARLVRVKGIHVLLKSVPLVLKEVKDVEFWVMGEGPLKEALLKQASQLGVMKSFKLLGYIPEPEKLLENAYALVMPSLYEPFGMPAAEAGACMKPVVAARTGGLEEIVKDGETGFLYEPTDHHELAEKLIKLLNDPELASRMGWSAYRRVYENFSPERVARMYMDLYREVSLAF